MKSFTDNELRTILKFTNHLADKASGNIPESGMSATVASFADARTTEAILTKAEREAKAYALRRNEGKGKRYRSSFGETPEEKSISASVKTWLARQRKRNHKV